MTRKEKIISFAWQHLLLFVALYVMTLGIAACVKSMLGASVISVLPYVFHDAGTGGLTPSLTIGQYTFIMNALLVVGQVEYSAGSLTRSNCSNCSWVLYSAC